uniref:Uncharacterized protein n=1 Tax=Romanomermis culicivorax TaxID=13658 RepID=A0A915IN87_ROMCU
MTKGDTCVIHCIRNSSILEAFMQFFHHVTDDVFKRQNLPIFNEFSVPSCWTGIARVKLQLSCTFNFHTRKCCHGALPGYYPKTFRLVIDSFTVISSELSTKKNFAFC